MQRHVGILDHLFGSQTRARLLRALLSDPERLWSLRELVTEASCDGGFARYEIAELERHRIIRPWRAGNRKFLQVDVKCPLYLGLRLLLDASEAIDRGEEPGWRPLRMPYEYRGDEFYSGPYSRWR